jgi:hypothetical protein
VSNSRRDFLATSCAAVLGSLAVAPELPAADPAAPEPAPPPGTPPAFGTAPAVGPEVSAATFAAAEKLVQVQLTPAQREQAVRNWRRSMAPLYERRAGPRRVKLNEELAPYSTCNPVLPGHAALPAGEQFVRSPRDPGPLPASEAAIAFAPVWQQSRWVQSRQLTSERLTRIYLQRIATFDPKLRCIITLTADLALTQAKQADREIAAGKYRGPLHGIPWGGKDLLDTAGIRTTYGAEPYRNRVEPGAGLGAHYHHGVVIAYTVSGRWRWTMYGAAARRGTRGCWRRVPRAPARDRGRRPQPAWLRFRSAARPRAASSVRACAADSPACGRPSDACHARAR